MAAHTAAVEEMLARTDTAAAPWRLVEGDVDEPHLEHAFADLRGECGDRQAPDPRS